MDAKEIIRLLEEPTEHRVSIKGKILHEAPIEQLIAAMHEPKTQLTHEILCELLGKRKDPRAVPVLLEALHDPNPSIRSEAAQALATIASPDAGEALLAQYLKEEDAGAKDWEVIALGAVKYRLAIPHLIQALEIKRLRRYAALALAELKAKEAREAVQRALPQETDSYEAQLMRKALKELIIKLFERLRSTTNQYLTSDLTLPSLNCRYWELQGKGSCASTERPYPEKARHR